MIKFSCLITVYSGTVLPFFKEAIDSIVHQTVQPDEMIIVIDGTIKFELEEFINEFISLAIIPNCKKIQLEENIGAGPARNIGIKSASFDWIAIMDCDDYAVKSRFEKQAAVASTIPDVDFICSLSEEYNESFEEASYITTKKCPQSSASIKRRLNFNCCITNPTIFFRKKVWEKTNGYASFRFLNEDHFFFLKVAKHDYDFYCIQEALLKVRIGKEQRKRRSGWKLFVTDFHFRYHCFKKGLIDFKGLMILMPLFVRRFTPSFLLPHLHKFWRSI